MKNINLIVTQEKREQTIEKIFEVILLEFDGIDVTATFTKKLLEDAIRTLESRSLDVSLKNLT